jgi:hypothetical protein
MNTGRSHRNASPVVVEDGADVVDVPISMDLSVEDGADVTSADSGSVEADFNNSSFSFGMINMDMLSNDKGYDGPCKPQLPRKFSDFTAATSFTDGSVVTTTNSFLDDSLVTTNGDPMMNDLDDEDYPNKDSKPTLEPLHEEDDESDKAGEAGSCCWRGFKCGLLFLVLFGITAFAVVMIGARLEKNNFEIKPSTHHYYHTEQVCAVDDPLTDTGVTFESVLAAHNAGATIAHCGDCGACSTAHDMDIMAHTADTLTRDTTSCAFKSFLGRSVVEGCMEGKSLWRVYHVYTLCYGN